MQVLRRKWKEFAETVGGVLIERIDLGEILN
jgi:hypothetical protein